MSIDQDHDFSPPAEKVIAMPPGSVPSNSKLSILSLISGVLGFTFAPIIGALLAIVIGHAALSEIRESAGRLAGRPMARAALWLGYGQFLLILIALGIGSIVYFSLGEDGIRELNGTQYMTRGVKLANELGNGDFKLIKQSKLDVTSEEIIACYNSGNYGSSPELALLTKTKLIYLKDGRSTTFRLDEIKQVMGDPAYRARYSSTTSSILDDLFHIEVENQEGQRMRIVISPQREGAVFCDALESRVPILARSPGQRK